MIPAFSYSTLCLVLAATEILLQTTFASKTGYHDRLAVGSERYEDGSLNGKFYLQNSRVVFLCQAAADRDHEIDSLSIGHSFASMGLAPVVKLKNTTWSGTVHFPQNSWNKSSGIWQLTVSKEDLFTLNSGTESWIAEVSLDASTQLLMVKTSLIDLDKPSFLNTMMGDPLSDAFLVDDVTNLYLVSDPCSPDISVLGLSFNTTGKGQGIILGVTMDSFRTDTNSTHWYNVTRQLCHAVSSQDCDGMTLIDIVLTPDPSLFLLTTQGLFLGQLLSHQMPQEQWISWKLVDILSVTSYGSFHLSYTPVCHNNYQKSSTDQVAYVLMINADANRTNCDRLVMDLSYHDWTCDGLVMDETPVIDEDAIKLFFVCASCNKELVYVSQSPYTSWTIIPPHRHLHRAHSLLYDHHTDSFIVLQDKKGGSSSLSSISASELLESNPSNRSRFPPFVFPDSFKLNDGQAVCFHPTTHEIFVYGNQVWLSNDGGNHFDHVLILSANQTINRCFFDIHRGSAVFISSKHKLYLAKTGVKRLIELMVLPALPLLQSLAVHITHTGFMVLVGISQISGQLWLQKINTANAVKLSKLTPHVPLAIQHITVTKGILYEIIADSDNPLMPRTLTQMTAGKQLNQENVGRATITDSLPEFHVPGYSVIVSRAYVYSQFTAESWQIRPALEHDVNTLRIDVKTVMLILDLENGVSDGWHCGDIGKTLIMPGASSILILQCHNHTHALGLALLPYMLRDTYTGKRWSLYDLRPYKNQANVINQTVFIDAIMSTTCLQEKGTFQFDQRHLNMIIEVSSGLAKIAEIFNESCSHLENITGSMDGYFSPGKWGLFWSDSSADRLDKASQTTLTERTCQHFLTPDANASQYPVRHLDVGDTFKFSVTAGVRGKKVNDKSLMFFRVSNPRVINVRSSYKKDRYGFETVTMTVQNDLYGKGSSSVTFNIPDASLTCPHTSFTLTFHATCPLTKHLHYVYDPQLSSQEFLHGNPKDSKDKPVLIDIPVNYRPPSPLGIAIPTSSNVYNVDPSQPRPMDVYQISKDTGTYKQCKNKASRADCGCTEAMRLSSLERDTDCRQMAYRLLHPGKLSLRFQILEEGKDPVELLEPYIITLKEINGRMDYAVEGKSNPSFDKISKELTDEIGNTSQLINPSAVRLILTGSGLYHFRASVISGFSYCDLEDEVQVYVDMAPLPNPTQMIVITVISVIIGGTLFSVYLYYLNLHHRPRIRKIGSQCMDPIEQRQVLR